MHEILLMMMPLAMAAPVEPGTEPTAPVLVQLMPLVLMLVIFYFMLIRPQQQKLQEHQKMVDEIQTGDEVITSGGIVGVVSNRKEKTLLIKVCENVKIEVLRSAIQSVKKPDGRVSTVAL